jgi:hypothetical protein
VVNRVETLLTTLAGCLCEEIRTANLPEPCWCGVMPGARIAVDYVGMCEEQDGMAWTRLSLAYPASAVGVPNQTMKNCSGGLGIEIELGVMRSSPTMTDDGEPPSEAAQLAAAQVQVGDMLAMMRAVACCTELQEYDYIMSQYAPVGPEGFAVGGTFTVMVAL